MTDPVITSSGLSVATQQSATPFEFSLETQAMEYLAYLEYCQNNDLLTVAGEQSRRALIKKTFVHKGGSGDSWREAMRSWLQLQTDSVMTSIEKLWQEYFIQHSIVPDEQGVTYMGMSVEAGYRKFLYQHIGLAENFFSNLMVTDVVYKKVMKTFSDSIGLSDNITSQLVTTALEPLIESTTINDTIAIKLKRNLTGDSFGVTDTPVALKVSKNFVDYITMLDNIHITETDNSFLTDGLGLTDSTALAVAKTLAGDDVEFDSNVVLKISKVFEDSIELADSVVDIYLGGLERFDEESYQLDDVVLLLIKKPYSDTITVTDTIYVGYPRYGHGHYNDYFYGA